MQCDSLSITQVIYSSPNLDDSSEGLYKLYKRCNFGDFFEREDVYRSDHSLRTLIAIKGANNM